jgi:ABC-type microcin C transport system permease subunit YejB
MLSSPGSTYAENLAATTMLAESLSVSVNVMVTALILFKLSRTWSGISKYFPNLQRPRMYTNAAAVVIESAAPLTVFGICYVIATALA